MTCLKVNSEQPSKTQDAELHVVVRDDYGLAGKVRPNYESP